MKTLKDMWFYLVFLLSSIQFKFDVSDRIVFESTPTTICKTKLLFFSYL